MGGGIKGVGSYVNGYGDNLKGAFAADGPVGGASAKKAAVKPGVPAVKAPAAQKALPGATKPLPKALPAATPKAGVVPRPAVSKPVAKPAVARPAVAKPAIPAAGMPRPASGAVKPAVGGARVPPASRPSVPVSKVGAKPVGKPVGTGKVPISAASRPKVGGVVAK